MNKNVSMKKRKLATRGGGLFLLALLILGGWWFLHGQNPATPDDGVLDIWVTWGDNPEALRSFFSTYSEERGIEIQVSSQIRLNDLQAGLESGEAPDFIILSQADPVVQFSANGWLEPLGEHLASAEIESEALMQAGLERCQSGDGHLNCAPMGVDVLNLYWNRQLFANAGLDPDVPPTNLEELYEFAEQLTLRDADGHLVQVGFIPDLPAPHPALYATAWSGVPADGGAVDVSMAPPQIGDLEQWQTVFNDLYQQDELDDFVKSITNYSASSHPVFAGRRLSCRGCHRTTDLEGKKIPVRGLASGQVAMMVEGSWELWGRGSLDPSSIGFAPFLADSSSSNVIRTSSIEGPVALIPSNAVDKQAAFQLLDWMLSPAVQVEAARAFSLIPVGVDAVGLGEGLLPSEIRGMMELAAGS